MLNAVEKAFLILILKKSQQECCVLAVFCVLVVFVLCYADLSRLVSVYLLLLFWGGFLLGLLLFWCWFRL